jgi:hypothetical protein
MKIAIIGSGFFGLATAFELLKKGHDVTVFEKETDILQGASKKNQLRFHLGYHYPRSQATVNEVKRANKEFTKFYTNSVFGKTQNYYSISLVNSKTSLKTYLRFVSKNKLYLKKTLIPFNKSLTSEFYLSKEKNLNYFKFKNIIKKKIQKYKLNLKKNTQFLKKDLENYDKVIVSCYSGNNQVLNKLGIKKIPKHRYELVEKILIKLPKKYRYKSFIVLDGDFVCLDPFLGTNYHLLSDVKNSKIEIIKSKFPIFKNKKRISLQQGIDYNKKNSNFNIFINNSVKYLPFLEKAKFVGSFKVVRTLSLNKNSKLKDERLSYISKHSKKIISILAGKWNTSISVAKKISEII